MNEKYKVRIIALDLDDTLLKKDLTISDYTAKILHKAAEQGIFRRKSKIKCSFFADKDSGKANI